MHIQRFDVMGTIEKFLAVDLPKHIPMHLNQRPILPFYNSILIWSVGGRVLVFKTLITAKGVKTSIFEFCAIVTANRSNGLG